jgi:putative sterol carrier protein
MFKLFMPIYVCLLWMNGSMTFPTVSTTSSTEKLPISICDSVTVDVQGTELTVKNLDAPHTNLEVYKIRSSGGWVKVFSCNDDCGKELKVTVDEKKSYKVHVKMFDSNWQLICEKEIDKQTAIVKVPKGSCEELSISVADKTMSIANLNAARTQLDVYKVGSDGSWSNVFSCNDNCGKAASLVVESNQKYHLHVKMFTRGWQLICEKQMDYTTTE